MLDFQYILGRMRLKRETLEAEAADCPPATQDVAVNLANRQNCIDVANYGPANPNEPDEAYWTAKAEQFKTSVGIAKTMRCANCAVFIIKDKMRACIERGLAGDEAGDADAEAIVEQADLGYCEMFDFKCAGSRTCDAWVVNGPLDDEARSLDCGTGAGGFKAGNTCAKGGVGSNTVYDNESLKAIGEPANYEGGDLVDGMTLWDRYSPPNLINIGKNEDIKLSPKLEAMAERPFLHRDEVEAISASMPLRTQYDTMIAGGLKAMGVSHTNETLDDDELQPHTDGWAAGEFSRTSQNELMSLMSEANPDKAELAAAMAMQSAGTSDTTKWITENDVLNLGDLAKNTPLPAGVTLFHGFKDQSQGNLFYRLAREQGVYSLNKLTSTSTRPSVATHFANDNKAWTETREVSVVRILNPKHGLAIGGVSAYRNEAEVVLARGTKFRFTGEMHSVNIPAANDSGWPSQNIKPPPGLSAKYLIPVKIFDVEVIE